MHCNLYGLSMISRTSMEDLNTGVPPNAPHLVCLWYRIHVADYLQHYRIA